MKISYKGVKQAEWDAEKWEWTGDTVAVPALNMITKEVLTGYDGSSSGFVEGFVSRRLLERLGKKWTVEVEEQGGKVGVVY